MLESPTIIGTENGQVYERVMSNRGDFSWEPTQRWSSKQTSPYPSFTLIRPPGRVLDYQYREIFLSGYGRYYMRYVLLEDGSIWEWVHPLDSNERSALWFLGAVYVLSTLIVPLFLARVPKRLDEWLLRIPDAGLGLAIICLLWLAVSAVPPAILAAWFYTAVT